MQNTDRHREWERERKNVVEGGTRAAFAVGHGACCVYVFSLNFYLFGSRSYFPVCPLSPLPPSLPLSLCGDVGAAVKFFRCNFIISMFYFAEL